ncbi:hypothetical protein [uncultured Hydrogenophaga sp.]|uniref:hypothetical protein n=1 Tax=uncultured Hydrogenophaga sp. TaxID=199683 RepID=UPI00265DFA6F|nr:hypothetical protein [uncultured Hydrogenophaga sp.]
MTEQDAFFTQTIVGAPVSVLLGRRQRGTGLDQGLEVDMRRDGLRLSPEWQAWAETRAVAPPGQAFARPGRWRLFLLRHAGQLAGVGLVSLLTGLALAYLSLSGLLPVWLQVLVPG